MFNPTQAMVGASAGVYSLLISHISHCTLVLNTNFHFIQKTNTQINLLHQNYRTLSHRYFRILAVFILCLSDIVFVTIHCINKGNSEPKISLPAHASGALAGLLLGFIVFRSSKDVNTHLIFCRYVSFFILLCSFIVITSLLYVSQNNFALN